MAGGYNTSVSSRKTVIGGGNGKAVGATNGTIAGVLIGAGLSALSSWRTPFFVFAVPIVVVVLIGLRLREPPRDVLRSKAHS